MINCSSCNAANRSSSRFCHACGAELEVEQPVLCPHCGETNPAARAFCLACEARLPRSPILDSSAASPDGSANAEQADDHEPAGEREPADGAGAPEKAVPSGNLLEGADAERAAEVASETSPSAGAIPLSGPVEETQGLQAPVRGNPPAWLEELPGAGPAPVALEEAPPGAECPDWLNPRISERGKEQPKTAQPGTPDQAAALPEWLRGWSGGSESEGHAESPSQEDSLEHSIDGASRPEAAGPVAGAAEAVALAPEAVEGAGVRSASDEQPVPDTASSKVAEPAADSGDPPQGLGTALAAGVVSSDSLTPDPPERLYGDFEAPLVAGTSEAPTARSTASESILALDCGSTTTRAFLFDQVEGAHRFLACGQSASTGGPPSFDTLLSVRRALDALAETTGGEYLDQEGQLISPQREDRGVDALVTVQSERPPLRLILVGPTDASGLDQERKVALAVGALLVGTVASDGGRRTVRLDDIQGQARLVQRAAPDVIVVVAAGAAGTDDPILESVRAMALASSSLPDGRRPSFLFAGSPEQHSQVAAAVGAAVDLRFVRTGKAGEGDSPTSWLGDEIVELGRARGSGQQQGYGKVAGWSAAPVLPASKAFGLAMQYLAKRGAESILGLDLGAARTTMASAADGSLETVVRSDLGLAQNAARILNLVPIDSLLRWLPVEMDGIDAANRLYNKTLHAGTLPQTREDLLLEQAVAREIIQLIVADLDSRWLQELGPGHPKRVAAFDVIVASGGVLAKAPSHGQAALMLVDALQPLGISRLYLDRDRLAAVAGAMAMVNPLAASQVLEHDGPVSLGTVVAPPSPPPETAVDGALLTIKVEREGGRVGVARMPYGTLKVIPLPVGRTATLEVLPDVVLDHEGQLGPVEVLGGAVGIIIDARGRPLPFAADPAEQRSSVQGWLRAIGA